MRGLAVQVTILAVCVTTIGAQDVGGSGSNCSFQANPDAILSAQARVRRGIYQQTVKLNAVFRAASPQTASAEPAPITHQNFIDDEIFKAITAAQVAPAALTTDEEFFRRINLDLTGRIPAAADVTAFVANTDTTKRNKLIEQLLYSDAFNDRWTMWLGDLVQNNVSQATAASNRQTVGRNAFYKYLYWSVAGWKSLKDIAFESITGTGNNFDDPNGPANFIMGGSVTGGPIQDTYDGMLVRTATSWLGQGNYDCLLCHNGAGHLDQINLWAAQTRRTDAESVAAFFSRTQLSTFKASGTTDPYYLSTIVGDNTTGSYNLNTNYGNRPNRVPFGTTKALTPIYLPTGAVPGDGNWRAAFAQNMLADPMFARNLANRLWKAMFNLGLVDPVDTLDPARLDPNNPPPAPWTFQSSNPVLLERLANFLATSNFDLRGYLRLLTQSSAYQLSSRYDGDWTVQDVPLFARHYPRRLEGEEVHDAVAIATGIFNKYTVTGFSTPFQWAMQLPDPVEPRTNSAVAAFMNTFLRGNRDTTQRNQASSLQQQLSLMNDNYVVSRTRMAASPVLQTIAKVTDNNAVVEQLFLTILSREPTAYEKSHAVAYLLPNTSATARNTAIEDLAWALINKLDFLFSY